MKKIAIALLMIVSAAPAFAATAFFTGRQEQVQTVTYQMAWRCEYMYNGQSIWQIFQGSCPASIQVQ